MAPHQEWYDAASLPSPRVSRTVSGDTIRLCDESGTVLSEFPRRPPHALVLWFGTDGWSPPEGAELTDEVSSAHLSSLKPGHPYRVLTLRMNGERFATLRFLPSGPRFLRYAFGIRESQNFVTGEAVLGPAAPDASQILPVLKSAFEVLQVENKVPRGLSQ